MVIPRSIWLKVQYLVNVHQNSVKTCLIGECVSSEGKLKIRAVLSKGWCICNDFPMNKCGHRIDVACSICSIHHLLNSAPTLMIIWLTAAVNPENSQQSIGEERNPNSLSDRKKSKHVAVPMRKFLIIDPPFTRCCAYSCASWSTHLFLDVMSGIIHPIFLFPTLL